MDILNSIKYLMEHTTRFIFLYSSTFDNMVEQLSVLHKLHDQQQLLWCFDYLIELHKIWMANELKDMNLSGDSLHVGYLADFLFLEKLDGYFLVGLFMSGHSDFSKCSLT